VQVRFLRREKHREVFDVLLRQLICKALHDPIRALARLVIRQGLDLVVRILAGDDRIFRRDRLRAIGAVQAAQTCAALALPFSALSFA